ncbi:MAG TPA: hypothetical protein DD640_01670 [Clostridiales bacterium]|nr:hypothetical protein [Clostridiales bacterium]
MKKRITAIFCLFVMLAMIVTACTTTSDTSGTTPTTATKAETTSSATAPRDVITIDFMSNACVPGLVTDLWWSKKIEEDIGVKLNMISFSPESYNTALAANDLPDITKYGSVDFVPNSIAANALINFDDYTEFLPNLYDQFSQGSLQYQRDLYGDGEKLYTIPDGMTDEFQTIGGIEYGWRLNWNYYMEYVEENGEPKLEELEDFLPLFKTIQDAHPTNADGQNTFTITGFPSWDASCQFLFNLVIAEMYGWNYSMYPLLVNQEDLSYSLIWDDAGPFKRVLKFLFDANQLGLVDPDAVTSTFEDYTAKISGGRALAFYAWGNNPDYRLLPFDNMTTSCYNGPWLLGNVNGGLGLWVSSSGETEKIERVCEFINYCMDYDNAWYISYGPQGEYWDLNSDGVPYITELGEQLGEDATLMLAEGGNPAFNSFMGITGYWRNVNPRNVHPKYGVPFSGGWALREGAKPKTEAQTSWENYMVEKYKVNFKGNLTDIELLTASDSFAEPRIVNPTIPDEIKDFQSRMGSVYENFWKLIYAKDQAAFDSLWAETQSTLQAMFDSTGYTAKTLFDIYNNALTENEKYFD